MSDGLNTEQLATLRKVLTDERDRLRARRGRMPDEEVADEVRDEPDRASVQERWNLDHKLGAHERERLGEVEAALARMEAGTYGICEETGDPIPFARLQSEPTTRYTVEALELLEQERKREKAVSADAEDDAY